MSPKGGAKEPVPLPRLSRSAQNSRSGARLDLSSKVKSVRLIDGDHDIDCKIDGIGAMKLKSEFVRKA
jgi:alkylphosphonate utilization operon protein PhnA